MAFELYGITEYLLQELSYQSRLDRSLKNTLRKFNKNDLINEILDIKEFYESTHLLDDVRFSYRVKSLQSCMLKYDKQQVNPEKHVLTRNPGQNKVEDWD